MRLLISFYYLVLIFNGIYFKFVFEGFNCFYVVVVFYYLNIIYVIVNIKNFISRKILRVILKRDLIFKCYIMYLRYWNGILIFKEGVFLCGYK